MRDTFLSKLVKVFDLLVCQCQFGDCEGCNDNCQAVHMDCSCSRSEKIPEIELAYIKDQRSKVGHSGGKLVMNGTDKIVALRQWNQVQRAEAANRRVIKHMEEQLEKTKETDTDEQLLIEDVVEDHDDEVEKDDPYYMPVPGPSMETSTDLTYFIAECVRYNVSDRGSAALYNAALRTLDMLAENRIVDKSKIRREKEKFAMKHKERREDMIMNSEGLKCIGADGKRNKNTMVQETQVINGLEQMKQIRKTAEHQVYTMEPAGEYLCHSEVEEGKGTGQGLADDMYEVLIDNNSIDTLEAVVLDGTPVNTGPKTELVASLERYPLIRRNLMWLICMLHGNEVDFRHLFTYCDGGCGISESTTFKGPLG